MKQLSTTNCKLYNLPEITIQFESTSVMDQYAHSFIEIIEDLVANGERFKANETFQVGWIITQFHQLPSGNLGIFEPNMIDIPIRFVNSVNNTLMHINIQKYVCESVKLENEILFPTLLDSAIVCDKVSNTEPFIMSRVDPEGNDSGWFIGCSNEDHDHNDPTVLKRVSLYEAAIKYHAEIIEFLALPPGIFLFKQHKNLVVSKDDKELAFDNGSYLFQRYTNYIQ